MILRPKGASRALRLCLTSHGLCLTSRGSRSGDEVRDVFKDFGAAHKGFGHLRDVFNGFGDLADVFDDFA